MLWSSAAVYGMQKVRLETLSDFFWVWIPWERGYSLEKQQCRQGPWASTAKVINQGLLAGRSSVSMLLIAQIKL